MSGRFDVVPDSLAVAAAQFRGLSDELGAILGRLDGVLAGTGGMAGGDRPGVAFSGSYDLRTRRGEHDLVQLAAGLGAVAEGLAAMAHNYGAVDAAAALRPTGDGLR